MIIILIMFITLVSHGEQRELERPPLLQKRGTLLDKAPEKREEERTGKTTTTTEKGYTAGQGTREERRGEKQLAKP